ncbi:hypothetical protein [Nannocystis radixulma]|uniref:MYXO-CTERM domain-containing protein n=1 Tax=Nannocystis radixulma TaxID=2995305 RepID=A0ABT5BDF3_9BACT|nr:hypothetical protein [Nannocystis radixulma]MDC0672087.1 hypothetical protein [Nannocystis radixulma]
MHRSIRALSVSLPLVVAALPANEAEACGPGPDVDACWYADEWAELVPVNAAAIPIDGVLVLQGAQTGNSPDAEWLAAIELTVTRDGQPIAGALETTEVDDVLVWRPAAPLVPGATYQVTGSLDNPDGDPEGYECGPDLLPLAFEFHADAGPAASLASATLSTEASVLVIPRLVLDELVCCDGAMPVLEQNEDCAYVPEWDHGDCVTTLARGRLQVVGKVADLPASTLSMTSRRMVVGGSQMLPILGAEPTVVYDDPTCTRVKLRNLANGETVQSEETCHGEDLPLGDQPVDPAPQLAELCQGPPYVCELHESELWWNPSACSPWPEDAGTTGDTTGEPETGGDTTGEPETSGPGTGATETSGETTGGPETGGPGTGETETDGASSGLPTTGGAGTDGPTTGGAATEGPTTGGAGTDGDATGAPGTTGDSQGSDTQGQDDTAGSGCGCAARPEAEGFVLAGLFLLTRRRRRTH